MKTSNDLSGKTCMVTGASSGIGLVTARELAQLGANVILVCRDRQRGENARREIEQATGRQRVELMLADFAAQQSIRSMAEEFLASGRPLHVLVNNAGVINEQRKLTADGLEETFAVNHLGYYTLTLLLLERLKQSAPARIVNVSSTMHRMASMNFDDLQSAKRYSGMRVYGMSKLANVMFTYELARKLEGSGVTVNAVHPGGVATGFGKNNKGLASTAFKLLRPFLRSPEKGAETSIYLAAAAEVEGISGKYFVDCKAQSTSRESYDPGAMRRLWEVSARLTGVDYQADSKAA